MLPDVKSCFVALAFTFTLGIGIAKEIHPLPFILQDENKLPSYKKQLQSKDTAVVKTTGPNDEWEALKTKLSSIKADWKTPPSQIINTKLTTGMLLGNGDIGIVAGDTLNKQKFYFGKSDFWGASVKNPNSSSDAVWQESILSLGGLTISSPSQGNNPASVYHMEQDILNAEVRTTMQLGNAVVNMTSWTADANGNKENNFFITKLTSDKDVVIDASLWVPSTYKEGGKILDCSAIYPYQSGVSKGFLWTARENYNNSKSDHSGDYKARAAMALSLIGASFNTTSTEKGKASGKFMLTARSPVYLIVAFNSKATVGDNNASLSGLKDGAINNLKSLHSADIKSLQKAHKDWWKNYWMKSYVNLGDPTFEKFYYGSLYMLGSSIREGNPPPSLFGSWMTTDLSSWGGRFFLNYNEQAALYGVYSSNRTELAIPYSNLIVNEMPWQRNRTHAAGYPGVCHQRSLTPYHLVSTEPEEIPVAAVKDRKKLPTDQKSNGMFVAMPLIWYYEYTQDVDYLRDKLYPYLKELDAFYRSYVTKDKKPYTIEHTSAHEGSDDMNPNLDIGYIRRLSSLLIKTSKILKTDADMIPVWQDMLDNLSDYPTVVRNGKTVYVESATKNGGTAIEKLFHVGCQPVNMEGGVFPGENIYLGGDEKQLAIARESLDQLGGWCVNQGGSEHNGFPKHWPVAARIGWPAEDLFNRFKEAIEFHWRESNLTAFQGGGGIETAGAIEGINSMLMQSEGETIRLFPVWPLTKDASFHRLRAKGAFLISSELKNGKVISLNISSEKGKPLNIKNPWNTEKVSVIDVSSGNKVPATISNGNISFSTNPGKTYSIRM